MPRRKLIIIGGARPTGLMLACQFATQKILFELLKKRKTTQLNNGHSLFRQEVLKFLTKWVLPKKLSNREKLQKQSVLFSMGKKYCG